jgi:hypothetical protein
MILFSLSPVLSRWRGVFLLVAVFALAPDRASAECGDYITIHGFAFDKHRAHSILAVVDFTRLESANGESPPFKRPCHGPNCSSSPARELPPLASVITFGFQLKELVQEPAPIDDETALDSSFDHNNTSLHPIYRTNSIFHPPRLG